jgi:hypothetical protein
MDSTLQFHYLFVTKKQEKKYLYRRLNLHILYEASI